MPDNYAIQIWEVNLNYPYEGPNSLLAAYAIHHYYLHLRTETYKPETEIYTLATYREASAQFALTDYQGYAPQKIPQASAPTPDKALISALAYNPRLHGDDFQEYVFGPIRDYSEVQVD
ncbi:hypothetical protein GF357_04280 [Candidatus Dojkabacteria bacterium]|nr:hypothetical protein [Candidatus Dojkabacteria bacterium]